MDRPLGRRAPATGAGRRSPSTGRYPPLYNGG